MTLPPSLPLSDRQRALVAEWLPGLAVVRDHSWGLVGTVVLEVEHAGERYVVKAADERDHHLARELRAHREWLAPWTDLGRAPVLAFADGDAKVLVTHHLPGGLVQGHPAADEPGTYRQAGDLAFSRASCPWSVTEDWVCSRRSRSPACR